MSEKWNGVKKNETEMDPFDEFIYQQNQKSFVVSGMLFQDAYTLDINRLRRCYLGESTWEGIVPFCAYNLTSIEGKGLYR